MRYFQSIAFAAALTFPAMAQEAADAVAPEAETGVTHAFAGLSKAGHAALEAKANGMPTEAQEWMVAAANPLAVEAGGAAILRQGGTLPMRWSQSKLSWGGWSNLNPQPGRRSLLGLV